MKRNILTIKDKTDLSTDDYFLYKPYKNLVKNLYELAIDKNANQFDIVYREFNGINNTDDNAKYYYEALLGVTSYFQASKGGRGKYLEKKLASISETCCIDNKISDLPKLLLYTPIVRKHKLLGQETLSKGEKEKLRLCEWSFIGNDVTTDLCSLSNGMISFLELKNRIDSGGTAARREIFDSKFKKLIDHLAKEEAIFRLQNEKYTLLDFLQYFNINKIRLALGILFSTTGEYATQESDKKLGFYSSSKEVFKSFKRFLEERNNISIEKIDEENLSFVLKIKNKFSIELNNIYGKEITQYLFQSELELNHLIRNKYDDIWLFQLLTIDERSNLLKYNENITLKLKEAIKSNYTFREKINTFIFEQQRNLKEMEEILMSLKINKKLIPSDKEIKQYLTDVLYFILSNEDDI